MAIESPKIPTTLREVNDFYSFSRPYIEDEDIVSEIEVISDHQSDESFYRLEVQNSVFNNCIFHNCDFSKTSFYDVVFTNCDLSNSKFNDAYFSRCQFINCKCVGVNLSESIMKHISIQGSNYTFSTFDLSKLNDFSVEETDLTDVSMAEMTLVRFKTSKSKFIKNNFFKTKLKGIDFTDSDFIAPTISSPPTELKGAKINTIQAADLIRLWGVKVE
jgi:uncharacterized protein YjbI with pentapeptide repeats